MLPKKIHFLSAPIDASFKLILFVFNFCVLPWSQQPFPTEPVYAAYRLLQWVQTSTLFSLAEVGSALPLDIGRFPVATAYIQPFELLFLRGWKAFSEAFTDVFQGMKLEQHVTDFEMQFFSGLEKSQDFTSKMCSWKETLHSFLFCVQQTIQAVS